MLVRAVEWFNQRGITVERVLSDNGGAYRSHLWRDTCAELEIKHKRTRPYRPQTNGEIERFHRTLADGWAYARCYTSEAERRGELHLAAPLQPSPTPHRMRQPAALLTIDQRVRSVHLGTRPPGSPGACRTSTRTCDRPPR